MLSTDFGVKHLARLALLLSAFLMMSVEIEAASTPRSEVWQPNGAVHAAVISADQSRAYIGGDFTYIGPDTGSSAVVNLSTAGDLPARHQPITAWPKFNGTVYDAVEDGSGGWYVGGAFSSIDDVNGTHNINNLAYVDASGAIDTAWTPNPDGIVRTMLFDGVDLYVGGDFLNIGGQGRSRIARLVAATGALDMSWDPSANGVVRELLLYNTELYVGGDFTNIGGQGRSRIARLVAATGSADGWDPGADGAVRALLLLNGTVLYVGGDFTNIGGQVMNRIARLDSVTGNADAAWNPNANGTVRAMAMFGTTLFLGGDFTSINGVIRNAFAAINWVDLSPVWLPSSDPATTIGATSVRQIALASDLYVAWDGDVEGSTPGRVQVLNLFNGAEAWSVDTDGLINALQPAASTLFIGGNFQSGAGRIRRHLAAVDINTATINDVNFGSVLDWNPFVGALSDAPLTSRIRDLALSSNDARLYVGGAFSQVNGSPRSNIASLSATALNGDLDAWDPSITGSDVRAMVLSPDDSTLYVGGEFTDVGGAPRNNIASIETSGSGLTTGWDPDITGTSVDALALGNGDGRMFVGGDFTNVGGFAYVNLAAISLSSANALAAPAWGVSNATVGAVRSLVLKSDGSELYVGGDFTTVGGQARDRIAALEKDASENWVVKSTVNPGVTGATVNSLDLSSDDQMLWLGGDFSAVAGSTRNHMARYNLTEVSPNDLTAWDPNVSTGTSVYVTQRTADDSLVVVGGGFTAIGASPRNHLAIFNTRRPTVGVDLAGGFYQSGQDVVLSCVDNAASGGCSIFYRTDGNEPTQEEPGAAATPPSTSVGTTEFIPIVLPPPLPATLQITSTDSKLKLFARDSDGSVSPMTSIDYTIDDTFPTTVALPDAATLPEISGSEDPIMLECDDVGGSNCDEIYYTTTGAAPHNADGTPSADALRYLGSLLPQQMLPLGGATLAELTEDEREVFYDMTLADIVTSTTDAAIRVNLNAFTLADIPRAAVALDSITIEQVRSRVDLSQVRIDSISSSLLANVVDPANVPPGAETLADIDEIDMDLTQITLGSITSAAYSLDEIPASEAPPPVFILASQVPLIQVFLDGSESRIVLDAVNLDKITLADIPPQFVPGSRLYANIDLQFFSIDRAGNSEAAPAASGVKTESYYVDIGAPETMATPNTGDNVFTSAISVTLTCEDFENTPGAGGATGGSGCAATYYTDDGTLPNPKDFGPNRSTKLYTTPIPISKATTLRFLSIDKLGNEEATAFEVYAFTFGSVGRSGVGAGGIVILLLALLGVAVRYYPGRQGS